MPWIGPKGEAVPPHPRPEPRFEGDLTAERIRWIFRDSADFGERPVLIGGDPDKRTTAFFLNGQVRNERMNDYILRPLATSQLLREAPPQGPGTASWSPCAPTPPWSAGGCGPRS